MYVELHARSAFSFLSGASTPEALAETAAEQGHTAMALLDEGGVYGAPRLHQAMTRAGLRAHVGAELPLEDGARLPVLVRTREGYQNLCRLITRAKLCAPRGAARIAWADLARHAEGLTCLTGDEDGPLARALEAGRPAALATARRLLRAFGRARSRQGARLRRRDPGPALRADRRVRVPRR